MGTLGGMVFFAHQLRNHILHQVWTSPVNLRSPWLCPRGGEDSLRSASGPRRRGQGREGWGCEPRRAYRRIRCLQCLSDPRLCLFPAASPSSPLLRCHRASSAPGAEVSQEAGCLSDPPVLLSFSLHHPSMYIPLRLTSGGVALSSAAVLQLCKLCPSDPPSARGGREQRRGEVR